MKNGKVVGGGIAVGGIILLKLAAKTAIFGAIFGGFFGGASYAKTAYQLSIDHMKTEAEYYEQRHGGEMLSSNLRLDHLRVDEDRKRIVIISTITDVDSDALTRITAADLEDAKKEDREHLIFEYKSDKDVKVLFEHGWELEASYLTADGAVIEDFVIDKADVI